MNNAFRQLFLEPRKTTPFSQRAHFPRKPIVATVAHSVQRLVTFFKYFNGNVYTNIEMLHNN